MIKRWGLVNPSNAKIPHPTAAIVGSDGKVLYLRQDVDYRQRPSVQELLAVLTDIE